jgi:hypothetical protein
MHERQLTVEERFALAIPHMTKSHFNGMGDSVYLNSKGANFLLMRTGGSRQIIKDIKSFDEDESGHYTIVVLVRCEWPDGTYIEEMGECSTRHQFHNTRYEYIDGKREKVERGPKKIPEHVIRAHAHSLAVGRAVGNRFAVRTVLKDEFRYWFPEFKGSLEGRNQFKQVKVEND